LRRVLVPLVCLVLAAGCGGSGTLTQKQLQKEMETAQSAAAEGELLASDVARDRSTETFARIHSGVLAEQAKGAAQALMKGHAPGELEARRRQAAGQARAVFGALEELHASPGDRAVARRVLGELEDLSK
jgi:hypothetical protein